MSKTKPVESEKPSTDQSKDQMAAFLKSHKDEHYNFYDDIDYEVSTGSLNLDLVVGGFSPGVHRLVGPASAGKTSEALEIARNFFNTIPDSKAIYVKTEGRLSENVKARSGLRFCKDAESWGEHMVFIFECNIYETIIGMMRMFIGNNPSNIRYLFIIDSADSVNLQNDLGKEISEANKVAGAPLLTKQFLQKLSLGMTKFGHMCLYIGQVSADIQLNPYAPGIQRQVKSAGGNAVQHFSNEVLEFMEMRQSDIITRNPDAKPDNVKNPIVGHICRIQIKKSDREKRFVIVEIPIKHNQVNGRSIWREREIVDLMMVWNLIERKGSWYMVSRQIQDEIKAAGFEISESFQGVDALHSFLEDNNKITTFLFGMIKKRMSGK